MWPAAPTRPRGQCCLGPVPLALFLTHLPLPRSCHVVVGLLDISSDNNERQMGTTLRISHYLLSQSLGLILRFVSSTYCHHSVLVYLGTICLVLPAGAPAYLVGIITYLGENPNSRSSWTANHLAWQSKH